MKITMFFGDHDVFCFCTAAVAGTSAAKTKIVTPDFAASPEKVIVDTDVGWDDIVGTGVAH